MAQELHRQLWRTANLYNLQPVDVSERLYELVRRYSNFDYGESLDRPDDDIEMAMDLYQRMPAHCRAEDAQRAFPGDTWAEVWQAIQNVGGCEHCQQFIAGCQCNEPPSRCPDCGSVDCICGGYPMMVGSEIAVWVDTNPAYCSCHGSGWCVSDYDTIHQCPRHYTGQPHPEDYWYN